MAGNGNDETRRDDTPATGRHGPFARSGADPSTRLLFARIGEVRADIRGQSEDLRELRREQGVHREEVNTRLQSLDDRLGSLERGSERPPSPRELTQRTMLRIGGSVLAVLVTGALSVGGWYLARVSDRVDQIPVLVQQVTDALDRVDAAQQTANDAATEAGQIKVWIEEQRERDGRQDQRLDRLDRRIHR